MKTFHAARAGILAAALLSGCVVAPIPSAGPYYGESVVVAPPHLQVEYPGPPPVAGYIWIGGYWNWHGGRHAWVPGRWEAPRRGQAWIAPRWDRDGPGWRQRGGYWGDDRRPPGPGYRR